MVGANIGSMVELEPRHLRQHLALERDRRQNPVKCRNPIGRDQNPSRGLGGRGGQIVAIADFAEIGVWQFGNAGVVKNTGKIGHGLAPKLPRNAGSRHRARARESQLSRFAPAGGGVLFQLICLVRAEYFLDGINCKYRQNHSPRGMTCVF